MTEDSRYPPISYYPKSQDDLIDFPCSPTWLNYYHELGLTPKRITEPPVAQQPEPTKGLLDISEDMSKLRNECGVLRKEVERLKRGSEEKKATPTKGFRPIQT